MPDTDSAAEPTDPISRAVFEARATYKDADKSPVDHGHAFLKGLDGRTKLAKRLEEHPAVDVDKGGYHGTTVHIDGVDRYLTAQRGAYAAFRDVLRAEGFESAAEMDIWAHAD